MKIEKYHYFYLFVAFLFLALTSVELFSDGMFMDGLYYADISRNMAEGLGSFWKPHFSNTLFDEFYEHPPLALGLQSLWFRVFGDSIYVERFYSLFTFIIVGYLIILIWGKLTDDKKNGWIPLFFWIIISGVTWSAANNMLENTMSIFVCLSVLFYLKSNDNRRIFWIILSGLSLSLGLLTKGFFCLYIWSLPFFFWLFKRKRNFKQMAVDTLTLISSTVMPIALLYFFVPAAQNNMLNYFNKQVLGSINNVQTVNTRFAIIRMFFERTLLPLAIGIIIVIIALKQKVDKILLKKNKKYALVFLSIVFSGILPIMVSMKQRGFYINTVYPLFAIGLAYYLYPILNPTIEKIKSKSMGFNIFKIITLGIITVSILLSFLQINKIGRDKTMIKDVKAVISVTGENVSINICPNMYFEWSLDGYFSRYGHVSLVRNQKNIYQYYLTKKDCNEEYLNKKYELVPIKTEEYKLYRLNDE